MTKAEGNSRLGRFIRFWRSVRGLSQEELADRLNSSQRHISRLENGSSRPSEAMLEEMSRVFELSKRDRNLLRIAAGFSPQEPKMDFHSVELRWLRNAMKKTLKALNPYPAALSDSASNLLMVNHAWVALYRRVLSQQQLESVTNHFEFLFSDHGGASVMTALEDTLSSILMFLQQSVLFNDSEQGQKLLEKFLQSPNVPPDWLERGSRLEQMSSFRIQVNFEGQKRSFYNVMQLVGSSSPSVYVAEPVLHLNTLYPEDDTLDLSSLLAESVRHPLLAD